MDTWKYLGNKPFHSWYSWDAILPFCLWNIWLNKKHNLFNNKDDKTSIEQTIGLANDSTLNIGNLPKYTKPTSTIFLSWKSPQLGILKLNTDESVTSQLGPSKLGGVFRDHEENWTLGYTKDLPHVDAQQAELLVILEGLRLALSRNLFLLN